MTGASHSEAPPDVAAAAASILVVDDDRINRMVLARELEREGHRVVTVEGGRRGLEELGCRPFDVVLLDVVMPDLDGYETLARIQADEKLRHIPVIMVSALEDTESVVRCIEMGAADYVPKPFDPVLLRARINGCLTKKRLHDRELKYIEHVGYVVAAATAVARSLAETPDPRDALARALAAVGESLGWRWGAVWEPAPERPESLRCVETWSALGAAASEFEATSRSTALAAGEGLPGRVWRTGEPAWIADVDVDENFPRAEAARRAGLCAAFCFPIRSARGVLGVIEFFTGEPRRLDAELRATMAALGDQIGQAVERRRDAEALGAKEARHRAMLDAALDCVVTIDHKGRVLDFNPAAERIFGYRAADAIGREMAALIVPPELRARHRRGLARYLATEEPVLLERRLELTGMRADGTTFPLELAITRIDLPGPPTFTGYLRDITERKAAEAELRESRARIVEAADAARRRLERDLHDGAQQRFTTVGLMLRTAEAQASADRALASTLSQAVDELKAGLAELRALARGLHPAILTDQGLVPALEALAGRAASPVRLRADAIGRLPSPVEATAYFVVSEALTNVAKHAAAAPARVIVERHDGKLRVEVADDGPGGATIDAGSGLRGLSDRVAAVDGRLELHSPARGGTRVTCELPCA